MNPIEYVRGIKRNFEKRKIVEVCDATMDELSNQILPVYLKLARETGNLRGEDAKSVNYRRFYELLQGRDRNGGKNIYEMIVSRLTLCVEHLAYIKEYITNNMNDNATSVSMSLKETNIMQLFDMVSFYCTYSARLANILITSETNRLADEKGEDLKPDDTTPFLLGYIQDNRTAYVEAHRILYRKSADVREMFDKIPEVIVGEVKSQATLSVHGKDKVDPLQFGFCESRANPIWIFIVNWAEYQATKYKETQEECRILELKIERYKKQLQSEPDPRLEGIIEKREAELDKKRALVRKMEMGK